LDVRKKFIVDLSHIRVVVWGIIGEFFPLDLHEKLSPMREYCLGPYAFFCVSKYWRLNENLIGGCPND
jgi:hypothetical protein